MQLQPLFSVASCQQDLKSEQTIHFKPKDSTHCKQAVHQGSLRRWAARGLAKAVCLKKVLLSSTSTAFHPHFPVHVSFF